MIEAWQEFVFVDNNYWGVMQQKIACMFTFVFPSTVSGSVLTPHLLKSRTSEFDLESISFLDFSGMGRYKKYLVGV